MINRIKIWLVITLATWRTPHWIKHTFEDMCRLDLDEPILTPVGYLTSKCSTLKIERPNGRDIVVCSNGPSVYVKVVSPFYAHIPDNEVPDLNIKWKEVYRSGVLVKDTEWVEVLKQAHRFLIKENYYATRERECLAAAIQGVM